MTEHSKELSFWRVLKSKKIVIPIIQRDYAQGREGKEFLRERFLRQLFDALKEDAKPLVLDFVYGSVEEDTLYPLDGQQRLTTLWLLHWYLALCAGTLSKDKEVLQRFSYETRVSSRTFCHKLCDINEYKLENPDIRSFIRDQCWYYSAYDQDPTIQSMLRMLEGIERKFTKEEAKEFLERLKDAEKAPIKFYLLNMEDKNMPLTDDLYIKMNARGKILTDFENFKADLLHKLTVRKLIPENDTNEDSFSVLMDTKWTDIFWRFHSAEYHIDEIYMSFLNRFFLNWYIANTTIKPEEMISKDLYKMLSTADKKGDKTDCHYQSITIYEPVLTEECIRALTACLNNLCKLKEDKNNDMDKLFWPYWKSDEDKSGNTPFYFIPHYETENVPYVLTYQQQVVFHAICVYLTTCKNVILEKLNDWMHFVWNIVENSYIDKKQSISAIRFFEKGINELPKRRNEKIPINASEDIIAYLAGIDGSQINETFGRRQLMEEIAKAQKKMEGPDWKEKIYEAENVAFFKGAIAFLFNNEDGEIDWNYFDEKMKNAKQLFDKDGVQTDLRVTALHTLYSYCDDWNSQFWWNAMIFDCSASTWKENILTKVNCNKYVYAKSVHHLLMGDSPSEEKKEDERLQLLANESFVRFLVQENTNNRSMYIRVPPRDALHYCGDRYGVMLSHTKRDNYLNQLLDKGKIELDNNRRIADTGLFWGGLDINFIYHTPNGPDLHLQWYRLSNGITYDIYLMTEDWHYMRRATKQENEQGDRQEYYCFNVEGPTDNISDSDIESFCGQVETEFKGFIDNNNI